MTQLTTDPTNSMLAPDADTARRSWQRVVSSPVWDAIKNNDPDVDLALMAVPPFREDLAIALRAAEEEMRPLSGERLLGEITRFTALMGGGWTDEARQEYLRCVMLELDTFPHAILLDAIRRARRLVRSERAFVAWICEDIQGKVAQLEARVACLREIAARIGSPGETQPE